MSKAKTKTYTEQQKADAIARIKKGETYSSVCTRLKGAAYMTVKTWVVNAEKAEQQSPVKKPASADDVKKLKEQLAAMTAERNALAFKVLSAKEGL